MTTSWLEITATIAELMVPILTALLAWVSVRVTAFIKAKVDNQVYQNMLTRLADSVFTLVREAEQTLVAEVKRARADSSPGGVKLTKEEGDRIKAAVLSKFKHLWGPAGIAELMRILGFSDGTFEDYLSAKIEEAVNVEKRTP